MKWLKKLASPLLLVAQGFAAGAILVFATAEAPPERPSPEVEAALRSLAR